MRPGEARAAHRAGGGQPRYSSLAITTALTLRAVFRLALRQTEGLIGSFLQLLGLDLPVPDHSTLSRRAERLEVPRAKAGEGARNTGRAQCARTPDPCNTVTDGVRGSRSGLLGVCRPV